MTGKTETPLQPQQRFVRMIKLFLCLIKPHVKKHIRVEVWIYAFLTSATDRHNGCISPREEALRTH